MFRDHYFLNQACHLVAVMFAPVGPVRLTKLLANLRDPLVPEFTRQAPPHCRRLPVSRGMKRRALLSLGLFVCMGGLNSTSAFAQGIITTVAGNGERGFWGNGGQATNTPLNRGPYTGGVAVDRAGNRYIADTESHRIYKVSPADSLNNRIRKVTAASAGDQSTFTNPTAILIPDHPNLAQPYPSNITVSGLSGAVSKLTVTLYGATYTGGESGPDDIDILLVGPNGQSIILMSDCCHAASFPDVLSFDDAAAAYLPALGGTISPGAYKPTNYGPSDSFPEPAPTGPYGSPGPTSGDTATLASTFNGLNPNGTWSLYAVDDNFTFFDLPARITGGWSITVTTTTLSPNPIDDSQFFIRQHYLDFLNRPADDLGLAFWTNEITSCGFDPQCFEIKRINASAAFFLSIEFQETGYLVHRMYKAAYGDLPGTPVPLTRLEFLPDTQRVGQGVVVGASNWQLTLENNKNLFASEFVARSRTTTAFPQSMTSEQFVDALNANADGALSQAERDQLVSELASGAKTRAQVLRSVAEDADLAQAEFNKAFVLMQYFGYLRRNPNDPPDTNFDGFNFWLNKLNQFNGNFVEAEMVKAFISSGEYRQRFGQP